MASKELTIISLDDPEEEVVEKKKKTTKTSKKKVKEEKPVEKVVAEAKEEVLAEAVVAEAVVEETKAEEAPAEKKVRKTSKKKVTEEVKAEVSEKAKVEETKVEETKVEETKVEEIPVVKKPRKTSKKKVTEEVRAEVSEETKVEEAKVEETKVEDAKVEEPKAEEVPVEKKKRKTSKKKAKEETVEEVHEDVVFEDVSIEAPVDLSQADEILVTLDASHHEEFVDELPDNIEAHHILEEKIAKKAVRKSRFMMVLSMLKDAVILTIITLVAGFMLGFVYEVTKTAIAEQEAKAVQRACAKVFESAASFELLDYTPNEDLAMRLNENGVIIGRVYKALDAEGTDLGYVIETTSKKAYSGKITLFMGVTMQNRLNGISILTISETPGLGMRADEVLVPQFKDKMLASFVYTKSGSVLANEIDAISGATITTKAVVNAVNGGVDIMLEELMMGGM